MPDQTMIERVKAAIRDEIATPAFNDEQEWVLEEGFRNDAFFADIARAVLAAMREPTEAMTRGAVLAPNYLEDQSTPRGFTNMWHAAIEAALEDGR